MLTIEDIKNMDFFKREALLNNLNTSTETLRVLIEFLEDYYKKNNIEYMHQYKYKISRHPNAPIETLIELSKHNEKDVRLIVAKNPNAPKEALNILSNDSNEDILKSVARNKNSSINTFKKLSQNINEDIREEVAKNPNTPLEILQELSKDRDIIVRSSSILNPNTPKEALIELSKSEDWMTKYYVAKNPNTPQDILKKLSKDDNWDVKISVAMNKNTSVETLEFLYKLSENNIKNKIFNLFDSEQKSFLHPKSNLYIKDKDIHKNISKFYEKESLAYNVKTIFEQLECVLASNPNIPKDILKKIAGEDERNIFINEIIAANISTPQEILIKLSENENNKVRYNVASNPNTPIEILDKLSLDEDDLVKRHVANNPNTSSEALIKLSKQYISDTNTVLNVASNPNTPIKVLEDYITRKQSFSTLTIEEIQKILEKRKEQNEFSKIVNETKNLIALEEKELNKLKLELGDLNKELEELKIKKENKDNNNLNIER